MQPSNFSHVNLCNISCCMSHFNRKKMAPDGVTHGKGEAHGGE
jgi:hypothetical protein